MLGQFIDAEIAHRNAKASRFRTSLQNYNAELAKKGILLAAEGLAPTSTGARVKFSGDKRTVTDCPFTETKPNPRIAKVKNRVETRDLRTRT
jgi:hypothetical protein